MHWTGAKRIALHWIPLHTFRRQVDSSQLGKSQATTTTTTMELPGWCLSSRPRISHDGHKLLTHLCADGLAGCGSDQKWCGQSAKRTAILWALGHQRENTHTQCGTDICYQGDSSWMDVTQTGRLFKQFCGATHDILATERRLTADWKWIGMACKVDLWPLPTSEGSVSRRLGASYFELTGNYMKLMATDMCVTHPKVQPNKVRLQPAN